MGSNNKKQTTEQFIEKSKSIYGDIFLYDKTVYVNVNSKVIVTCKIHGDYEQFVKVHYNGAGCTKCSRRSKHTTKTFIEEAYKIHSDRYNYDKVVYGKNNKQKLTITCKIHGDFLQRANDHLSGKGCVKCAISDKMSKVVKDIRDVLDMKNVSYEMEKTFDDCKNILPLRFDFYLPTFNMCIEYDGLQHFESCGWGGEEKLKLTQKNDKIKNDYCIQNNIKLLRIKYDEDHIKIVLENIS